MARISPHDPSGMTQGNRRFAVQPSAGDTGTEDGVPWQIGRDGVKYYIGDCGGCGGRYPTTDWQHAARNACSRCDWYGGPDGSLHMPE
jgi:hypothetical protein